MASQSASLYGFERKPPDTELQSSIGELLRSRISRFLTQPAPWKKDLRLIVKAFRENNWDAVVFGGVLRDLALYGPSERPRDVDIVVNCLSSELSTWLSSFPVQQTRFGGFRVRVHKWNFDIWSLRETWAFATANIEPTFENLPKTTFSTSKQLRRSLTRLEATSAPCILSVLLKLFHPRFLTSTLNLTRSLNCVSSVVY